MKYTDYSEHKLMYFKDWKQKINVQKTNVGLNSGTSAINLLTLTVYHSLFYIVIEKERQYVRLKTGER